MAAIRLLLVDDEMLITQSFKALLEAVADDIEVVETARDGRQAVAAAERLRPDVVLMDVRMPVMDGVEATRVIRGLLPDAKIIMLTTFDDDEYVKSAILHGATGYLLKDISTDELLASIRAVHRGAVLLSRKVAESMALGASGPQAEPDATVIDELSHREREILRLLARGLENKEIAADLAMAEQSVKNAVSRIYQKLGVPGRPEARRLAVALGLAHRRDG